MWCRGLMEKHVCTSWCGGQGPCTKQLVKNIDEVPIGPTKLGEQMPFVVVQFCEAIFSGPLGVMRLSKRYYVRFTENIRPIDACFAELWDILGGWSDAA